MNWRRRTWCFNIVHFSTSSGTQCDINYNFCIKFFAAELWHHYWQNLESLLRSQSLINLQIFLDVFLFSEIHFCFWKISSFEMSWKASGCQIKPTLVWNEFDTRWIPESFRVFKISRRDHDLKYFKGSTSV